MTSALSGLLGGLKGRSAQQAPLMLGTVTVGGSTTAQVLLDGADTAVTVKTAGLSPTNGQRALVTSIGRVLYLLRNW